MAAKPADGSTARNSPSGPTRDAYSRQKLPALGTWVTLMQGKTETQCKARASNVRKTPALVSAVSMDGLITVLYPNNFVLMHGFKGEPLKRVPDVPAEKLRPFTGTDFSLQLLEKAMKKAIKAEAGTRSPSVRARSRSRSPRRGEVPSHVFQTPEAETPQRRRLFRKQSEEKEPTGRLSPKATPSIDSDDNWQSKYKSLDATPDSRRFTSLVGKLLRTSECARLPREKLEASLADSGFDTCEIAVGLQRLDSLNKILLMDGLVFQI